MFIGSLVEVDLGVEFRGDEQGRWSIWELPPPKVPNTQRPVIQCVVGADPAEGIGGDRSAAVVRDGMNRGVKAVCCGQLDPDQFAYELIKVGRFYHGAQLLCERNGPGFAVNADLVRSYGHVYHERVLGRDGMPITKRFGWLTNAKTRDFMLSQFKEEIRTGAVALRDARLIEECKTFVVNDEGKAQADAGYTDDLVMAGAMAGAGIQLGRTMVPAKRPPMRRLPQPTNLAG